MTDSVGGRDMRAVLVVDDEPGMRTALQANFLRHGWNVKTANGVHEAASLLKNKDFDLVVSDIRMRDGDGFEVMNLVRRDSPNTAVILLTAFGSVPEAVKSMRSGAFDYLTKPVSFDQLQAAALRVMGKASEAAGVLSRTDLQATGCEIVGRSPALLQTLQRARAAASTDSDVLIQAESGTGKDMLARLIHESSDRSRQPYITVNCAAILESLIECELFGDARSTSGGANKIGKFELANGGTLLLDEIDEMPLKLQPKLLRVLQEREFERTGGDVSVGVDVRVIATTSASLSAMVERGTFRSDLFYRLNVIPLSMPPLRERFEDVAILAQYFAEKFSAERGGRAAVLDASFVEQLLTHNWPGNVRELSSFIRRVVSLYPGQRIDADCFRREIKPVATATPRRMLPPAGTRIADLEKTHLENTLSLVGGNRTHAAEMLGISLRTMRNKIKEYGLPPRRYA